MAAEEWGAGQDMARSMRRESAAGGTDVGIHRGCIAHVAADSSTCTHDASYPLKESSSRTQLLAVPNIGPLQTPNKHTQMPQQLCSTGTNSSADEVPLSLSVSLLQH